MSKPDVEQIRRRIEEFWAEADDWSLSNAIKIARRLADEDVPALLDALAAFQQQTERLREALLLTCELPALSVACAHKVAADPDCTRCRFYHLRADALAAVPATGVVGERARLEQAVIEATRREREARIAWLTAPPTGSWSGAVEAGLDPTEHLIELGLAVDDALAALDRESSGEE